MKKNYLSHIFIFLGCLSLFSQNSIGFGFKSPTIAKDYDFSVGLTAVQVFFRNHNV